MKSIGMFEAKTHLSALVADAIAGRVTVITRNGKPVAELRPISEERTTRASDAARRLRATRKRLAEEGKLRNINIRELIDEGRK